MLTQSLRRLRLPRRALVLLPGLVPCPAMAGEVRGFRSAEFGMDERAVQRAIRQDFPGVTPQRGVHPQERTVVLTAGVDGLLPDAGRAEVAYILGHASRRLAQVNLLWRGDGRSAGRDAALVAGANLLRERLLADHAAAPDLVANRQAGPQSVLVLRAAYADGRMVVLLLAGAPAGPRRDEGAPPLTLQLSYILDHRNPDVYRLQPGQF